MLEYLVFAGVFAQLIGISFYLKDTLAGKNKPNRVSFLLWSASPLIAAFAGLSQGLGWAALPIFMAGFGPLIIFFASYANKKSYWGLKKFDYLCGLLSILALVLWQTTGNPVTAILLAIVSDALATLPTLAKTWKYPDTETPHSYLAGMFSVITSLVTVSVFSFPNIAFQLYIIVANTSILLATQRKKLGLK